MNLSLSLSLSHLRWKSLLHAHRYIGVCAPGVYQTFGKTEAWPIERMSTHESALLLVVLVAPSAV